MKTLNAFLVLLLVGTYSLEAQAVDNQLIIHDKSTGADKYSIKITFYNQGMDKKMTQRNAAIKSGEVFKGKASYNTRLILRVDDPTNRLIPIQGKQDFRVLKDLQLTCDGTASQPKCY